MTSDAAAEIRTHVVCSLPALVSRTGRAQQVRTLCLAKLERDRRRARRVAAVAAFGRHLVPALAAGLFALYARDVVSITLRTFSV
jgi:hypothetical protein